MRVFLMVLGCVYFDMNHNTRVYSPCGEKGDHLRGCEWSLRMEEKMFHCFRRAAFSFQFSADSVDSLTRIH